jgi:predicted DsbA family dithiol-disulfide isomerase
VKRYGLILIIVMLSVSGCAKKEISKKEFEAVWQNYLKREFEESFDEKQSTVQREKILIEVLKEYKLDLEAFKTYMKKEQEEKYKKIFLN